MQQLEADLEDSKASKSAAETATNKTADIELKNAEIEQLTQQV